MERTVSGERVAATKGDLLPVALGTPMNITNASQSDATFLIIKTPNPSEIK